MNKKVYRGKTLVTAVLLLAFAVTVFFSGCSANDILDNQDSGNDGSTVSVTGVYLNKTSTTVLVDGSEQLFATVEPSNATNKTLNWTSSDNSIATVTGGLVVGKSEGLATVTVTTEDGAYTDTCDVTVTSTAVSVDSVSISASESMNIGETLQLTATISPSNATNQNITWASGNTAVATVSESGIVTAVTSGASVITVTTEDGSHTDTCDITVITPVNGVSLDKSSITIPVAGTDQLTATISSAEATNQNVTWSSDNTDVAAIDSNGLVTGVAEGSAVITVTTEDGSFTDTCNVSVVIPVTGIAFNLDYADGPPYQVEVNDIYYDYYIQFTPWNATNQGYSLSSSNPAVASIISEDGIYDDILGVSPGTAVITITTDDGGFTDSFTLEVIADSTPPEIDTLMFFSSTQLILFFSEDIDQTTAETASNYVLTNQVGNSASVSSASLEDSNLVYLTLDDTLTDGDTFTITVSNIEDLAGNAIVSTSGDFEYVTPPTALDPAKIVVSGGTIYGTAGAGATGNPNLFIIAVENGNLLSQSSVLGISILDETDGSFIPIMDDDVGDIITFPSGDYDLYVQDEITGAISTPVTVTVP